jgi:hypothetical protein
MMRAITVASLHEGVLAVHPASTDTVMARRRARIVQPIEPLQIDDQRILNALARKVAAFNDLASRHQHVTLAGAQRCGFLPNRLGAKVLPI